MSSPHDARGDGRRHFLGKLAGTATLAVLGGRTTAAAAPAPDRRGRGRHILILGSGFAALTTIRRLRALGVEADITVVSPRAELVYLPSLIWLPSGQRRGEDLRVPLEDFFRRQRVHWQAGRVRQVLDGGRRVLTEDGELRNDYLVIATGGRYLRKLPGIEHAIIPCEGIEAAEAIGQRLAALDGGTIAVGFAGNPQEPGAVRGGPMFEFLSGLDTLLRRQRRRARFELVFFNPSTRPGSRLGAAAVDKLLAYMGQRGIHTRLGHKPLRFEPGKVVTEGGEFAADLILFMPGLTGPDWLASSDLPHSPGGFVDADAQCRVRGCERVYVAGDAGRYPGPNWMAKQAHQADLQAEAVAANIAAELRGQPADRGFETELVCIVDDLDAGMLIYRTPVRHFALPRARSLHWAKQHFEARYLKAYR